MACCGDCWPVAEVPAVDAPAVVALADAAEAVPAVPLTCGAEYCWPYC